MSSASRRSAPRLRSGASGVEDVAEVATFLAGAAADYITGQSINVTGGGVMH